LIPAITPLRESWQTDNVHETSTASAPDVEPGQRNSQQSRPSTTLSSSHGPASQRKASAGLAGPSYEDLLRRDDSRPIEAREQHAGVTDSIAIPKPAFMNGATNYGAPHSPSPGTTTSTTVASPPPPQPAFLNKKLLKKPHALSPTVSKPSPARQDKELKRQQRLVTLNVTRRPPMTPVLHPVHRYCPTDRIIKPYRAHHCRVCGTVSALSPVVFSERLTGLSSQ
jgi:palmitoyltransferase